MLQDPLSENPILPGFHPDPSIIRVEKDYYLATSTFEWFPGVRIYHSLNLVDWELIARPLNRLSQLDMRGHPDSCGVWAPCLSYSDGIFYLTYTNTSRYLSHCKDTPNYVVTTEDIRGDWSDPFFLNSSGFDPSLFHDSNGKKWLLNMVWDHRQRGAKDSWDADKYFGGIALQEYDAQAGKLVGKSTRIFSGSALGKAEGPHIYQRDDYYYLLVAEGGTGIDHACTMARSRNIEGPYEVDPSGVFLTSAVDPGHPLQRAGHGDLVDTPEGKSYLVHLCSRPLPNGRSVMGRETALQEVHWHSGWPRLSGGSVAPSVKLPHAGSHDHKTEQRYDFNDKILHWDFQTLRNSLSDQILSLTERPGYLRLRGRDSLGSFYTQALVARRQQFFVFEATTAMDFQPVNFQQMAGLVCYYNSCKYHYLFVTWDEDEGPVLDVMTCRGESAAHYPLKLPIALPTQERIYLRALVEFEQLHFQYATEKGGWLAVPVSLDYSLLSDEVGENGEHANFTGSFVGLCCQDLSGERRHADFEYFHYKELR
jgi:xylan 1,4-beta-xylosidase